MPAAPHPATPGPNVIPAEAWTDWGGEGPILHFAHANGFPPGTYRKMFAALVPHFHVVAMEARPMWPEAPVIPLPGWAPLVRDLGDGIRGRGLAGCVGVGHSLGAVCSMLAAAEDPGLFRALVVIDPVLFTGFRSVMWRFLRRRGWMERVPLIRNAANRRDRWVSREAAREAYQAKAFFATWDPECLDDYLASGLAGPQDALRLRYPREWEAQIFAHTPASLWRRLARVPVPTLVVRGAQSDALTGAAARRARDTLPHGHRVDVPGTTHMLPVEQPEAVARIVWTFLRDLPATP